MNRSVWAALLFVGCSVADGSALDGSSDDGARLDATPGLDAGVAPVPWQPPRPHAAVCDDDDLRSYLASCIHEDSAIPIACQQFVATHPDCAACLAPSDEGPLIAGGGVTRLNVGGCVALTLGDASPESCGARESAAQHCVLAHCADPATRHTCRTAPDGACRDVELARCAELGAAATCASFDGAGSWRPGGADARLDEDLVRVARAFCGT